MNTLSRRRFLGACLGCTALGAGAAAGYTVFRYLSPLPGSSSAATVSFPEHDIVQGEAKFFQYAGSAAVLVKSGNGRYFALSAVCTHLGCVVQWQKDKETFLCPCHAGLYSAEGAVLAGPPPAPLRALPVLVSNGIITVG